MRPSRRDQRGVVTAELALALPLLLAVTVLMVWLLAVGAGQVRVVDAAREVARALARGEDRSTALAVGRRVAPDGSTIGVGHEADAVVVRVRASVPGPGGLGRVLPDAGLSAEAVALREPGEAAPGGRP